MKNTLRYVFMTFMWCFGVLAYGQGPACTDLNVPVGQDDTARIVVSSFVTNAAAVAPLTITVQNSYGSPLLVLDNASADDTVKIAACVYLRQGVMIMAEDANGQSCMSNITFKYQGGPSIVGRSDTVYCGDPLVAGGDIDGVPPLAYVPCSDPIEAEFVADWIETFDCVPGENVAKIIYREYAAYDKFGNRGTGSDTIYVFRLPEITTANLFCAERDTTYCGVAEEDYFGPFMLVPDLDSLDQLVCDTIWFINPDGTPATFDPKCGISIALNEEEFAGICPTSTKYTLEIKQSCFGTPVIECADQSEGNGLEIVAEGYYVCEFWRMDIDTVPPVVYCDATHFTNFVGDTIIIPASSHDCVAHLSIPPAIAADSCGEIVAVKAMIPGYGSFQLESVDGITWGSSTTVKIPLSFEAIPLIYEAYDECHIPGYDTCYIKVKDLTAPVAVCDKGINVSLNDKKVWVNAAETFDEGSWDNCDINFILGRRSDWQEACLDLCDSLNAYVITDYGTIYTPYLSDNKHDDEVEGYYKKTIEWLDTDGDECERLVAAGWAYDLAKYATVDCEDEMDEATFDDIYLGSLGEEFDPADIKQIGGGWAEDILFTCDDACGPVTVEILVMDYWCNYSKCWTDVWVEDKTPIRIAQDVVEEIEITCKSYRDLSLDGIVDAATAGDSAALAALDDVFGGYVKGWIDAYGNYVDENGDPIGDHFYVHDSICDCLGDKITIYETDEHGITTEEEEYYRECFYLADSFEVYDGVIGVNCATNVECEQTVWSSFDACGQGVVYRKFKIWQGCPTTDLTPATHVPDTITRIQKIWVGNNCELDRGMFSYPEDVTLDLCGIEYDPEGSGNVVGAADPSNTGEPEYLFDDDCRLVGIGYYDKVFRVVGGDEACYKIIRTWCFADWCDSGKPATNAWIKNGGYGKIFEYEQKIIVRDTVGPACIISGPVEDGGTIEAPGCDYNFSAMLTFADSCGLVSYSAILEGESGVVTSWSGDASGMLDGVELSYDGLLAGEYTLTAIVTDDCQNESLCTYSFTLETGKKPTPVCITSMTVELTPWDTDGDNIIDTAAAVIWAEEFNSSSYAPCGSDDEDLEFYIEFVSDFDADTLNLDDDADSLALGCEHIGDNLVRMWVLSPTGSADYCDVILIVQDNMGGCGDISANQGSVTGLIETELEESVEQVNVKASLSNGTDLDFITTRSGAYGFASTLGVDVTIEPVKDIAHDNGISTADMIQIQKHILGKGSLENEYRKLAADVNNDGKVSALDLLDIRRLILGKTDRFPNSDSWAFMNTVDGKSTYTIKGLDQSMQIDFVGVKKGDVNISNDPSRSAGRTSRNLVLQTSDLELVAGNQYRVEMTADNFSDIEGYQFTVNFDPAVLQLVDIENGAALELSSENFSAVAATEGVVTTSWHNAEPVELEGDEVLFTLVLEAVSEGQLSQVMTVNNRITSAEAYNSSNELLGVALEFTNAIQTETGFALYQNRPNPFKDNTVIGFNLPEAASVTLTVYDVTGKLIKVVDGDFTKGYNQVSLRKSDLNVSGVLYYQLDSDTYTATRKMIVVD